MTTIAKLAHWIWFGHDIPNWAIQNIETFKLLHPTWEVRVWHELPSYFPDDLRQIMDSLPWYSSKSDIFRYWLLAEYGGVYCDTDIVALRNFEPLLGHNYFLAPCMPTGHTVPHITCALMGSTLQSVGAQKILAGCRARFGRGEEPRRITYGPDLLTELFSGVQSDAMVFPLHYFYVIPDRETTHAFWHAGPLEREEIMQKFRPFFTDAEEPYAIHLWGVNGSSQRMAVDS
jgi:hypothetical protein